MAGTTIETAIRIMSRFRKEQLVMTEPGAELLISRLALVETLSGFAAKVRTGVFPVQEFQRLRGLFLADVIEKLVLMPLLSNAARSCFSIIA